jgi:hypothetical protein
MACMQHTSRGMVFSGQRPLNDYHISAWNCGCLKGLLAYMHLIFHKWHLCKLL